VKPVFVPTTDVNSDEGVLVAWCLENRSRVAKGALLAEVETSKAVIAVEAPDDGFVLHAAQVGETISLSAPIAQLFDDVAALESYEQELAKRRQEEAALAAASGGVRATQRARIRAEELGVDLSKLSGGALITVKEVEAAAAIAAGPADYSAMPEPLSAPAGVRRLLLIGGALGATQVLDILRDAPDCKVVAILDDDRSKWGREVYGAPLIGGTDRLKALFASGVFEAAIITVATSIAVRVKFGAICAELGIPLANAIDRTAKIASEVKIGTGNVVCAFCHFGTGTVIGDNNFFSAYASFDHHNIVGSEVTTGPSCATSGLVKIGNRVKMGTGVHIEPKVDIGDDVQIASGAIILRSVPAGHAIKTKVVTTTVVPIRKI